MQRVTNPVPQATILGGGGSLLVNLALIGSVVLFLNARRK